MVLEEGRKRKETAFDKVLKALVILAFLIVAIVVGVCVSFMLITWIGGVFEPAI